ncbi:MAG: UbiA-like polyprenyltransferase, partial [bacterium]
HLPSGSVKSSEAWGILVVSGILFVIAARALNPLAFYLSPVALLVICGYSFTKRFTWASHLILGSALAMAPIGAWIAVTGRLDFLPFVLGAGVVFWVAGFDIIYALVDEEFDRTVGLHSLVVRLGRSKALLVSRVLHAASVVCIGLFGGLAALGGLFWTGWCLFSLALAYEQHIIHPHDLSRVNVAFFNVNGSISILLFLFGAADVIWL